jgi:alpha-galactosidase
MADIQSRSAPGGVNDMDMLEVGNQGQIDSEYVAHFSMWAINSSPLLMGTNVISLSPANLAILSNPAVIALNQDPSSTAAVRKWRMNVSDVDQYGVGEISLWTRVLNNGDSAVALLNAGNASRQMTATAEDIFLDQATAGTYQAAPELSMAWDVYDLWAGRMSNPEAASILNGSAAIVSTNSTTRYNASAMSYADGLNANVSALLGTKVGTMQAGGQWSVQVDRHSVALFRFRPSPKVIRKRDEL